MYDADTNSLKPITEELAKIFEGKVSTIIFKRGEVVTLKGLRFSVLDIAPKQIKLKLIGREATDAKEI